MSFWIQVCHPHLQISLFKWLNHILKMVSMLRFCHFYKKTLNFTFVISIQNDALCYSECCTDFINCCVSSIQSYSTSKCVDQPDKSALFWIEVRFSKWRYIILNNENKWGFLYFALMWLFSVNLNESSTPHQTHSGLNCFIRSRPQPLKTLLNALDIVEVRTCCYLLKLCNCWVLRSSSCPRIFIQFANAL